MGERETRRDDDVGAEFLDRLDHFLGVLLLRHSPRDEGGSSKPNGISPVSCVGTEID